MTKDRGAAVAEIPLERARAFWWRRQGFERPAAGAAAILRESGWMNTAGSTGPYLSFRARDPKCGKSSVDAAVYAKGDLVELFTVRGCTMVVPAADAPLALAATGDGHTAKTKKIVEGEKLKPKEMKALEGAIQGALAKGGKSAAELRAAVPKNLVRPFGEVGRKLGESSSLMYAVRGLQVRGLVRRAERGGRLDGGDFEYRLVAKGERGGEAWKGSRGELHAALAERFFHWTGPAALRDFAWWADIPQKEASVAAAAAGCVRILVPECGEMWVSKEDLATLERPGMSETRGVRFLPFRDNYLSLRRGLTPFLSERAARESVLDWYNKPVALGDVESLHHHAIVVDGRLAGIWDFDPKAKNIAWATFEPPLGARGKDLARAAEETQSFVRAALGDLLFYAIDNEKNRAGRLEGVEQLRARMR